MEQFLIGEYIRRRREDLGITQAQLCEGICEPATLSRLENSKQAPSYHLINTLLQRLGLPGNRYFALLNQRETDIENLRKEISNDEIAFERASDEDRPRVRAQALERLAKLERLMKPDDRITRQYILGAKAALGGPEGPYSFEERLNLLMEAIRLTVPRFDLDELHLGRYSIEETTIINKIARTYSRAGQKRKAIDIYRQLLKYIEKNDQELPRYAGHFCLVAHNCAIALALEKRYDEAVELAERGWQTCTRYGNYLFLPGFLAILAECRYFMGQHEQSAKLYIQACCIYEVTGDQYSLRIIQAEMKERLGLEMPY